MKPTTLKFSLVTPIKKVVQDAEVSEVLVPANRGQLNILPGHSPLLTTLAVGVLKYKPVNSSDWVSAVISWGYCEVNHESVLVFAETAETKEDLDVDRAKAAMSLATEKLSSHKLTPEEIQKFQRKQKRANIRLELGQ